MNKKNQQKGFSLVELLVVVAIIGILAAVGVVTYNGYIQNARETTVRQNHASAVAFVTAESAKCAINSSGTFLLPDIDCSDIIDSLTMANAVDDYISTATNYTNPYPGLTMSPDAPIDAQDEPGIVLPCGTAFTNDAFSPRGSMQILHDSAAAGIQGRWITIHSCVDNTDANRLASNNINMY